MPLFNTVSTHLTVGLEQVRNEVAESLNKTNEIRQYLVIIENTIGIGAMVLNDGVANLANSHGWGVNLLHILTLTNRVRNAKDDLNEALKDVMQSCKHLSIMYHVSSM